jgi:hypothetical protein
MTPIKAWYIGPFRTIREPIIVLWEPPDSQVCVLFEPKREACVALRERVARQGAILEEQSGVEGIAQTNRTWDGCTELWCRFCGEIHDVHEVAAEGIYHQGKEMTHESVSFKRKRVVIEPVLPALTKQARMKTYSVVFDDDFLWKSVEVEAETKEEACMKFNMMSRENLGEDGWEYERFGFNADNIEEVDEDAD